MPASIAVDCVSTFNRDRLGSVVQTIREVDILELWDVYDGSRQPLGRLHRRGEAMRPGEYHIVVNIWTVNSRGEILVTLRHPDKEAYPETWENTGGSALAGETSRAAAVRELKEETGITVEEHELAAADSWFEGEAFMDTYFLHKDIEIRDLRMQEGETIAAQWISLPELDRRMENGSLARPVGERLHKLRKQFEDFLQQACRVCRQQPQNPAL